MHALISTYAAGLARVRIIFNNILHAMGQYSTHSATWSQEKLQLFFTKVAQK